jgi:Tol biopolymer transport system component
MKRLLSVVAILVLAASLLPVQGHAGLRGGFDPISNGDFLIRGKLSPALRGLPTSGAGTNLSPKVERWLAFVTLSSVVGSESVGEIWLYRNASQAFFTVADPVPVLADFTGVVSYIDPAWSKDGKWLAYVQTDNSVSAASIYVQQFDTSTATDGNVPLGSPILIADGTGGVHHRHPVFNSTATQIAYDSDAFGPSVDLWTVDISLDDVAHTGTVNEASRTRHQLGLETDLSTQAILNGKAEFKPAYSPDNSTIAYVTNRYGPFQIQLLSPTASGLGETVTPAEVNPALVTHDNPSFSSDGTYLFYDAPSLENSANPQDIYRLNLATGEKCNIFIDLAGDTDPNVSQWVNLTANGEPFNYFVFISQAAGFGVQIWRAEAIQNCTPPLAMGVVIDPEQVDLNVDRTDFFKIRTRMPASTRAAGYINRSVNVGGEGLKMRTSIIASPTVAGLAMSGTPLDNAFDCTSMYADITGDYATHFVGCFDLVYYVLGSTAFGRFDVNLANGQGTDHEMVFYYGTRRLKNRLIALGLVGKYIGIEFRAYSNNLGQQFLGYGYLKLLNKNVNAGNIALMQNYPNPFNPATKVDFAVSKPGNVEVRVFNIRGELVKTIVNQWFPQGSHSVSWDGKTQSGGKAPSGIYYMRAKSNGSTDVIKAVLAK